MTSAIGVAILGAIGIWLFGGLLARWTGTLLIVAGSVGLASTGDANGFLLIALGAALWLVGQPAVPSATRHLEECAGRAPLSCCPAAALRGSAARLTE